MSVLDRIWPSIAWLLLGALTGLHAQTSETWIDAPDLRWHAGEYLRWADPQFDDSGWTQPAQTIAEAARAWGQNDDITVVTVRRKG